MECSNFRHSHSRSSTEFSATSPSDRAHSAVGISPRLVQVSAVASSGPRFSFSCRGFDFLRWPPFFLFGWPFVPWQHHAASSFPVARRQVRPFLLPRGCVSSVASSGSLVSWCWLPQWVCVLRCFLWLARVLALVAQCFLRFGPVSMAIERLARVLALVA